MTQKPTLLIEEDSNRTTIHLRNVGVRPVQIKVTPVTFEKGLHEGKMVDCKFYGPDRLLEIMPDNTLQIAGQEGPSRIHVEAGRAGDVEYVLHSAY